MAVCVRKNLIEIIGLEITPKFNSDNRQLPTTASPVFFVKITPTFAE